MARSSLLILVLLLVPLAPGCQTTMRKRLRPADAARVDRAQPVRAWNALVGGALVGEVVRFDSVTDGRPVYVVRNPWRQDLGIIDRLGRVYRFRPHAEEPDWLGTGTIGEGAARILEAASIELHEVQLSSGRTSTFDLWTSSEIAALEAGAARETASSEPTRQAVEIPARSTGTPQ